jgi:hypothetical protein
MDANIKQPHRLAPPPEWWQASATIVGIIGIAYILLVLVPHTSGWDPLHSLSGFYRFPLYGWLAPLLDVSVLTLSVLYLATALRDPGYGAASWRFKLFPWIVFFGVMLPLIPAIVYGFLSLSKLHDISRGWGLIGHRGIYGMAMFIVPLFNWICAYRVVWRDEHARSALSFMNGLALVAAPLFAGVFWAHDRVWDNLPVAGIGMLGGMLGAFGILAVMATQNPPPGKVSQSVGIAGLLLGFFLFVTPLLNFEFHMTMTRCAAAGASPEAHRVSVRMLRAFGNRDDLLRGAYGTFDEQSLISGDYGEQTDRVEDFRRTFYWVNGKAFNEVEPPWDVQFMQLLRRDRDLAGENAGEKNHAVSLESSQINASLDPDELFAGMAWTMILKNSTNFPQEARMEVLVPKGAVVSRAVLFIDEHPTAATISPVHVAREAYRSVVLQQRDPLLVSWKGPDRVMVQCYPIPPKNSGKRMKIEIELQMPMQAEDNDVARVDVPWIVDSNFALPDIQANVGTDGFRNHDIIFGAGGAVLTQARAHAANTRNVASVTAPKESLDNVAVVIDGAGSLASSRDTIIRMLKQIPAGVRTDVFFASDEVVSLGKDPVHELAFAPFVGGPDNSSSLRTAFDIAPGARRSAVIWIHGPQPVIGSTDLTQHPKFSPGGRRQFFDVQLVPGANVYASQLPLQMVHSVSSRQAADLAQFIDDVTGVHSAAPAPSPHSAALAAAAQVEAMRESQPQHATEVAIAAGIVTPLTSAIVLEPDDQQLLSNNIELDSFDAADSAKKAPEFKPQQTYFDEGAFSAGGATRGLQSDFRESAQSVKIMSQAADGEAGERRDFPAPGPSSMPHTSPRGPIQLAVDVPRAAEPGSNRMALAMLTMIGTALGAAILFLLAILCVGAVRRWYRRPGSMIVLLACCGGIAYLVMQINTIFGAIRALGG